MLKHLVAYVEREGHARNPPGDERLPWEPLGQDGLRAHIDGLCLTRAVTDGQDATRPRTLRSAVERPYTAPMVLAQLREAYGDVSVRNGRLAIRLPSTGLLRHAAYREALRLLEPLLVALVKGDKVPCEAVKGCKDGAVSLAMPSLPVCEQHLAEQYPAAVTPQPVPWTVLEIEASERARKLLG